MDSRELQWARAWLLFFIKILLDRAVIGVIAVKGYDTVCGFNVIKHFFLLVRLALLLALVDIVLHNQSIAKTICKIFHNTPATVSR